jgi:hypothetical protein
MREGVPLVGDEGSASSRLANRHCAVFGELHRGAGEAGRVAVELLLELRRG